jgi:hypothetical protein
MDWKKLRKRIPHRIQVAKNAWYEVVYIDDFKDGNTYGETRFDPRQIVIQNGLPPKLTVTIFLHEACHAFSAEHDINLTETQILALEKAFYYMLKTDNLFVEK